LLRLPWTLLLLAPLLAWPGAGQARAKPARAKPARAKPARKRRPRTLELPLLIRVAGCGGKPVRTARWVERHLAAAIKIFARHGIRIVARQEPFRPDRCELLTRAHRHAQAAHVTDRRRVTVLVMKRVRDLDVPTYDLMGVHWRYRGSQQALKGRRWVFLTARAKPPVLAHELGHYLGLPHDAAGGNLMTPGPSAPIWKDATRPKPRAFRPILTARQGRRARRGLRRWRRERGQ
jgi:hypothetical protein